jgi:DNA-binding transcriptional LysR family regulator
MDKLNAMRTFVAVADAESFTLAAERLSMSRAMTSKHVMDLEARLGLRLLNRTTRTVVLTEAGAAYAERCREILGSLDEAEREVTSRAIEPVGRLRVSAPMSFGIAYIAPRLDAYALKFPRVDIDLVLNDRVVDIVEEGYDVAIRIGRLAESMLVARRIASGRRLVCASPAYFKTHGRPKRPGDLSAHTCLHYAYALGGSSWTFDGALGQETVRVGGRITCNNGDAICAMALKGMGIIYQPDFIVAPHIKSGALTEVLEKHTQETLGIYAIHQSHRHVPQKVRSFIDFLAASFSKQAPWQMP